MLNVNTSHLSIEHSHALETINSIQINILEKSTAFSVIEKVNLLALLLHKKWIADIGIDKPYDETLIKTLQSLSLYSIAQRQEKGTIEWLAVSTSQTVLDYIQARKGMLSDIEAGVLYGLPPTHILAFSGILPRKKKHRKLVHEFYFTGVFSEKFANEESRHAKETWELIKKTSPLIAEQAEKEYKRVQKEIYGS